MPSAAASRHWSPRSSARVTFRCCHSGRSSPCRPAPGCWRWPSATATRESPSARVPTPELPDPRIAPDLAVALAQRAPDPPSPPVRLRMPLVELHHHLPDARQPPAADQPIEEVVLAALDVDLHEVDGRESELAEDGDDVANAHRRRA